MAMGRERRGVDDGGHVEQVFDMLSAPVGRGFCFGTRICSSNGGRRMVSSLSGSSPALIGRAHALVIEASRAGDPGQRFLLAHLSALRTAAALLAAAGGRPPRRPTSAWTLLADAEPSFADRAVQFAAGAQLRALVEAGVSNAVAHSRADAEVSSAVAFLVEAEQFLGMSPVLLAG